MRSSQRSGPALKSWILPALLMGVCLGTAAWFYASPGAERGPESDLRERASEFSDGALDAAEPDASGEGAFNGGPIVIELFTSQGCSSCPPADRVLSLLRQTGQIDGIPIVTLSEHVDYWNRLGWTDPYSMPLFSDRQAAYARAINRSNRIYTPQMVVDGREEFVGHDLRRATEAVRRAADRERIPLELNVIRSASGSDRALTAILRVRAKTAASRPGLKSALSGADVLIAISEDGLDDRVQRGENAGHTLRHDGVVRQLIRREALASATDTRAATIKLNREWKTERIRIVAWLQDRESLAILGAATAGVPEK